MRITVQLMQNYVLQQCPSIIVTCENSKYIFNVPSTFQRFLKNHRSKMSKGINYFFTKASSQSMAGLNGFMLTIFQTGSIDTKLFLSKAMFQYLQDTRYKMGFKMLPFSYCSWQNPKQKNRLGIRDMTIIKQLVQRQDFADIFDNLDLFIQKQIKAENINDANACYSQQIQGFKDKYLEIIPIFINTQKEQIINYICRTEPVKGKVLIEKVRQFGIPQKLIQKILEAETFKLANSDRIIRTAEIKQQDKPGRLFFILHINSIDSIDRILADQTFKKFTQKQAQFIDCTIFIIQQTAYLLSPQFRILLKAFPQTCNHIINAPNFVDKNFRIDSFIKPHMQVISQIHRRFPIAMPDILDIHQNFMHKYKKQSKNVQEQFNGLNLHVLQQSDEICLLPTKSRGIIKNKQKGAPIPQLKDLKHPQKYQHLLDLNKKIDIELPFDAQKCDPKIVFLGTGSMKPGTYRNVSSILVQYDKNNSFLLDCGQSSMYQMMNHYPAQEADHRLLNVRVIFITHIHSDHNLGILDLIGRRNRLMKKYKDSRRIFLVIPCNVYPWYYSFLKHIEDLSQGCDLLFIQTLTNQPFDLDDTTMSKDEKCKKVSKMISQDEQMQVQLNQQQNTSKFQEIKKDLQNPNHEDQGNTEVKTKKYHQKMQEVKQLFKNEEQRQPKMLKEFQEYLSSINISGFLPTPVIHCPQSYGIIIENKQANVKISYSGDTRPFEGFAKAALNSTLMIHQATFGDDLAKNANENQHSTVGQAMDIGMKSNSWKTALTHFSQRYVSANTIVDQKNYNMIKNMQNYLVNHTIVCFDHLEIRLSRAPRMPLISQGISQSINSDE